MFLLNRFTEVLLVPVFYLLARSTTKNSPHQRQQVCPHPYKFFNALHGSKMCSFSDKVKTNSDNMQMSRSEWNVWLENLLLWQIHHLHLTVSFFLESATAEVLVSLCWDDWTRACWERALGKKTRISFRLYRVRSGLWELLAISLHVL